jgi:hypothetical protein
MRLKPRLDRANAQFFSSSKFCKSAILYLPFQRMALKYTMAAIDRELK